MDERYDVSVFIVTDDDLVYMPEYVMGRDPRGRFVMLTNDVLNPDYQENNTIFINCGWRDAYPDYDQSGLFDVCQLDSGSQSLYQDDCYEARKNGGRMPDVSDYKYDYYYPNEDGMVKDIAADDFIGVRMVWQVEQVCLLDTVTGNPEIYEDDMDGIRNTHNALGKASVLFGDYSRRQMAGTLDYANGAFFNVRDIGCYIPVFVTAYRSVVEFRGRRIHGYLPAIGQIDIIAHNIRVINESISNCFSPKGRIPVSYTGNYVHMLSECWWSSTETSNVDAAVFSDGKITRMGKWFEGFVLPLYDLKI